MKLHLPSALRKAVLACLAAFALPATLPTTLGTASGIAAAWLLSSQAARADVSSPAPEQVSEEDDEVMPIAEDGGVSWTATAEASTLTWDASSNGWTGQEVFADTNGVTFLGAGANINATITVGAAVTAGSLTIGDATAGAGAAFTLTAGAANVATNTVTVTGAVILNGGSQGGSDNDPLDAGYVLKLENVNFTVQGGLGGSGTGYGQQGKLIVGSGATVNVSGSIAANVGGAAAALIVNHLVVDGGTLHVTENGTWVNTGWGSHYGTHVLTEVTGGGILETKNFGTGHSVLVEGSGSSMTVDGTAKLTNNARLTVRDGGSVTITGALTGNKPSANQAGPGHDYAGVVTVGSHEDAGNTNGTLTLGTDGTEAAHKTYAVKVYGGESTLTVYGNLSAIGSEKEGDNDNAHDTGVALEVMYGATATVSGTLTCESASALHLGGEGEGNTGTLTVGGLSAGTVDIGAGSTLNLAGAVGVTQVNLGGTLAIAGAVTKSGDGEMSIVVDTTGSGKLHLSGAAVDSLKSFAGLQLTLEGKSADEGWTYDLFDMSAIDNTVATAQQLTEWVQSGVVDGYFRRALSVNDQGQLVFDSTIRPRDLTWGDSVSTWVDGGGSWETTADDKVFYGGDTVIFNTEGEHTVSVSGTVEPGGIRVESGTWTFSVADGSASTAVAASGTMTVGKDGTSASVTFGGAMSLSVAGGATVKSGSTLSVSATGTVNFGTGITLEEGAVLEVVGGTGWNEGAGWNVTGDNDLSNSVKGSGTIVLRDVGDTYTYAGGSHYGLLRAFLQYGESSAKTVKITGSSLVKTGSSNDHLIFEHIQSDLWVGGGVTLRIDQGNVFADAEKTLHLEGDGYLNAQGSPTVDSGAALVVNANLNMGWNVVLEGNASLKVKDGVTVTLGKNVDFGNGSTLTKKGTGGLTMTGAGTATGSGTLDIAEGKVNLGASAGDTTFNAEKLAGIGVNVGGELHVNQSAEVGSLSGTGSVTFESGKELTIVGGSTQEFTGTIANGGVGAVHVGQDGTLTLGAGAVVGNEVKVEGKLAIGGSVTAKNNIPWTINEGGRMEMGEGASLKVDGSKDWQVTVGGTLAVTGSAQMSHGIHLEIGSTGTFEMTGESSGLSLLESDGDRTSGSVLRVEMTDEAVGGKLKLSNSAMGSLKTLGEAGGLTLQLFEGEGDTEKVLDYREDWTYQLFNTEGNDWSANAALDMLKALLGPAYVAGGRRSITVSAEGVVSYTANLEELTWSGGKTSTWMSAGNSEGDGNWEDGGEYFTDGDSVNFDATVEAPPASGITVVGTVQPNEMTVKSGEWSFTGEEGADVTATSLWVEKGASAAIGGALGLHTGEATVNGGLRLGSTAASLSLGAAEVGATGAIYIESVKAAAANTWSDTSISGDGKVVLGVDATVDGNGDLFAALFAGGDVEAERGTGGAGIGTFEVAKGATLTVGEGVGKSVSFIRNMRVEEGGTLKVESGAFDSEGTGYTETGTITLSGSGVEATTRAAGQGPGALVFDVDGGTAVTWDIVLEGDTVIANEGDEVRFTGDAKLDAAGHTLTFTGGAFRFGGEEGGFYAAEGSSGTLALEDGVSLTVQMERPADYSGYDIELLGKGATLALTTHSDATFNNVSGSGRVIAEAESMLVLVGKMGGIEVPEGTAPDAEPPAAPDVVLREGAGLIIRGNGGKEGSRIGILEMDQGDARMELTLGENAEGGVLEIGEVKNNTHTLTLRPDGIQNYIDAHRNDAGWDWKIQLFTGDATESLYGMWQNDTLLLEGIVGYDWKLNGDGELILDEITDKYIWTDTKHGSAHRFSWREGTIGGEAGKWDGGATYKNGATAELIGDTGEAVTVTVYGNVEARELRISGTSAFTFEKASESEGGSLHVVDMEVGSDSTFDPEVTLERKMTVQKGKTATFTGGVVTANGSEVALVEGATVKLVGDHALKAKAGGEMKVTGSGNWDVDLSGASDQTYDGTGVTVSDGVKMRLTGVAADEDAEEGDVWSNVSNLNVQGELELVSGKQVVFTGTSRVGKLTADYTNSADAVNVGQVVLEGDGSTLSVTGEGDTDLGHVVLDLRSGTFTQMKGTLTVGGLRSNLQSGGVLEVQNLAITAEDTWDIFDVGRTGGQRGYSGSVHVAGNFTMNGKVWEEGNGGDAGTEGDAVDPGDVGGGTGGVGGNVVGEDDYVQHLDGEVTVGGTAMVQSGVLDVGGSSFTVGEQLGVSGGQFKWHGGEMEVGSLNITGDGTVELTAGEATVNGGISGDGGTLDISGAPIEGSTDDAVGEARVTLKGEESASYAGEVRLGKGGTLAVESTGQVLQRMTAAGGNLSVGEGKNLTVGVLNGTAPNPGLVNVTLGAGANWTVQGGSFTLTGELTWGAGASITLEYAGEGDAPNILLGGDFRVPKEIIESGNTLTFNLSAEYLKYLEESGKVESDDPGRTKVHFLDNDRDGSNKWSADYADVFIPEASDDPWNYSDLKVDEDGYLTWVVREGVTWFEAADGGDGVWSDTPSTSDTTQGKWVDVQDEDKRVDSLEGENVYFTERGAGADGQATLNVEGAVTPGNVYVEGGVYTLKGDGGGIKMGDSGMLVVEEGAVLNLNLENTSLPMVIVEGKLGLGNAGALPTGTELRLNKEGTLSYTVAGATQDVSGMVSAKSKSTALHIEVGEGVGVTWDGATGMDPKVNNGLNNGLKLALDGGTVKSGKGSFTLEWTDADAATHAGKQEVQAGSLTLEAGGKSVLSGEAAVADGATLVLKTAGALTYSGAVTGGGTLEVARGAVTLSGNNTVSKITLTGGTTILGSDGGLGNGNTLLTLTGGNIKAGNGSKVNAGTVEVVLSKEASIEAGSVEFTGKVTGRGTLRVKDTAKGTFSGDISGFNGTLDTGTSSWTLSRIAGKVHARVMGKGKLVANSKEEIILTGELGAAGDEVTLQNDGSGDLVIATSSVGSGTKLQTSRSGDIVLGNAGTHVVLGNTGDNKTGNEGAADASPWSFGAVTGEGSVILANVTLPNAGVFDGLSGKTKLTVRTAVPVAADAQQGANAQQGGLVDVAGMDAGKLSGITVNEHGLLSGADGTYKASKGLELHFTAGNWAEWKEGMDTSGLEYLIGKQKPAADTPQTAAEDNAGEPSLTIDRGDGTGLGLAFDASVLTEGVKKDVTTFYVHALDGDTATWNASTDGREVYNALANADDQIARVLAMAWNEKGKNEFTEDGLVLTVELRNLYLVMGGGVGDPHESTSPYDLMGKKATVVLDGQTLTLNWAEDGTVSNLVGTEGTRLEINNTAESPAANRLEVTFDNTFYSPVTDDRAPSEYTTKAEGQDTEFAGAITGGEGVDITKDGLGTLTVGGNYTLADGTTRLEEGSLVLSGEENAMKALEFAYQKKADKDEERGLVLDGGHTVLGTISEKVSEKDSNEDVPGAVLRLQHGAELSLSGESTLSHTDFTGGEGSGTVVLEGTETGGGALALTGDASIKDVAVKLNGEKTVLDVGGGENSLVALNGNGVLRGAAGGNLTISGSDGGTFSGTLDTTPGSEVGGKLTVQKGASFTLQNASSTATDTAHGWNVDVQQGGSLTLDLTGKTASSPLVFGDVNVAGDMTMKLDANLGGAPVKGNLTVTDTSTFTVYGTGKHGDTFSLGFSMAEDELDMFRDRLTLDGAAFLADVVEDVKIEGGTIWITTRLADENRFTVRGAHKNAQAGSTMLWDALQDPNGSLRSMLDNPTSGFAWMVLDIYDKINKGGDTSGVDRALAAIAGSSISTLGSAVSQDMHRQLTSIRNRTTTMAAEVTPESYGRLPLWHAWINGETGYHKLDADSFAPGFTLNNWGGTIGVDVDLTPHATAGLAVTAMYGDLKTEDAPDTADGSVDSVYVSAFLRATSGSWVHSLVISAGAADISLDRTVSYGGNSYRTNGSTDGYSLGALYEVGYSRIMNKRGTVAVQPVVNVEIRHVGVDGYTETGSDGALKVDDIDQTVVTFGAGARMQAAMGTNAFNRTAVFESRLLVKVDAGDRSGAATTGLKGSNGSAEVESAEVGALGVEAGAGVSVPLGRNYGSLFLDGSVEFRDGWTSANATLGYRINF